MPRYSRETMRDGQPSGNSTLVSILQAFRILARRKPDLRSVAPRCQAENRRVETPARANRRDPELPPRILTPDSEETTENPP
jgi:hypothetical protein